MFNLKILEVAHSHDNHVQNMLEVSYSSSFENSKKKTGQDVYTNRIPNQPNPQLPLCIMLT